MGPSLRALGLALVCTHLVVASTPCGGTRVPVGGVAASHAHEAAPAHGPDARSAPTPGASHAHAHAHPHAAAHDPARRETRQADAGTAGGAAWRAVCPCGCDGAPDARVPGRALDPALRPADVPPRAELALAAPAPAAPRLVAAPGDGPEPVPRSA